MHCGPQPNYWGIHSPLPPYRAPHVVVRSANSWYRHWVYGCCEVAQAGNMPTGPFIVSRWFIIGSCWPTINARREWQRAMTRSPAITNGRICSQYEQIQLNRAIKFIMSVHLTQLVSIICLLRNYRIRVAYDCILRGLPRKLPPAEFLADNPT